MKTILLLGLAGCGQQQKTVTCTVLGINGETIQVNFSEPFTGTVVLDGSGTASVSAGRGWIGPWHAEVPCHKLKENNK